MAYCRNESHKNQQFIKNEYGKINLIQNMPSLWIFKILPNRCFAVACPFLGLFALVGLVGTSDWGLTGLTKLGRNAEPRERQ